MSIEVNNFYPNSDPDIARRLGRIEKALTYLIEGFEKMTKTTDAALAKIEASVTRITTVVDAVKAFIEANVTAQAELIAELTAEGVDVTKLEAFNAAMNANADRLAALVVTNTPADPGDPIPAAVSTP